MYISTLLIIFISLVFSGFFSGMEIAFVSANKLKFEIDKKERNITSNILNFLFKNPQQFISTILVGNNIALVVYGLQMAILLEEPLKHISGNGVFLTVSQTLISTFIVLITGEFIPKTIFRINPNLWLRIFAIPVWICYICLYPISTTSTLLSVLFLRLFGMKHPHSATHQLNRTDLNYWFQENIDNTEAEIDTEVKIFRNALDFSSVKLKDCLIPRTEMVALEENSSTEMLKSKFIETGLSKIVIYKESIDNILGYIHTSEILKNSSQWKEHINTMPIVPETMPANKLLELLIKQKKSMAIVVDEFGGTAGIITREDIMEEIVGEIEDEHDSNKLVSKKVNDNEYIFSGRMEIDTVNQEFGLNIPESDDYVTIAGYILHHFQNFPKTNEIISIGHFQIKILLVTNNKIELVNIKRTGEKSTL